MLEPATLFSIEYAEDRVAQDFSPPATGKDHPVGQIESSVVV